MPRCHSSTVPPYRGSKSCTSLPRSIKTLGHATLTPIPGLDVVHPQFQQECNVFPENRFPRFPQVWAVPLRSPLQSQTLSGLEGNHPKKPEKKVKKRKELLNQDGWFRVQPDDNGFHPSEEPKADADVVRLAPGAPPLRRWGTAAAASPGSSRSGPGSSSRRGADSRRAARSPCGPSKKKKRGRIFSGLPVFESAANSE